ncbi:BTAD domain-containing putative transcriptional regulator [Micromonospora sp. NPDC049559]|uniref:AfsR/SARP family transcriptional regulator n=1 Tax=Micromonospora sp. NPDC049559 TaxID=3155923 RepID=UPI00342B3DA6
MTGPPARRTSPASAPDHGEVAAGPPEPVRVALLGPLLVRTRAGWDTPGSPLLRAVLGVLALAPGTEVTVAGLYTAAWPAGGAGSAKRSVHLAVHRLRRWLAEVGAGVTLHTSGTGYRLDLAGGMTDVELFHALAARVESTAPAVTVQRVIEALALWRGPALADVPVHDGLGIAQLHRQRRQVAVAGAEAALAAGDWGAALALASPLAEEDPLDEATQAIVVRALAGAGRQADALAVYERVRDSLADELGVDPSRVLHEAYLGVLRQGYPEENRPRPSAPCTLPADVPDFVGRDDAMARLTGWCHPAGPAATRTVIVLSGAAGVGKTTLAVRVAHRLRVDFPDGQLYLNLRGFSAPLTAIGAAGQLLRALGVPGRTIPTDADERGALIRSLTVDRRYLFVLDDAADETQVRQLLPGAGGGVLVTSRRPLSGLEGAHRFELNSFSEPEAVTLLRSVVGAARLAAEPEAGAEILRRCAGLPLAIRIIAERLAARPDLTLGEVAAELAGAGQRLDPFAAGDLDVRASIGLSYRALPAEHRRALRMVALLAAPDVPKWVFAAIADDPVAGESVVDSLVTLHLIEYAGVDRAGQHRYRLNDLVRAYARERAGAQDADADRRDVFGRVIDGWLGLAGAADLRLRELTAADAPLRAFSAAGVPRWFPTDPGRLLADPMTWFEAELPSLLALVGQAGELGLGPPVWALPVAMAYHLELTARARERIEIFRRALGAARAADDPLGVAYTQLELAGGRHDAGDLPGALAAARAAADSFDRLADAWGAARAAFLLAQLHEQLGDVPAALGRLRAALWLYRFLDDRTGQGLALTALARMRYEYGNSPVAARHFRRGLALLRAVGSPRSLALGLRRVAMWHEQEGRIVEALAGYRECLGLVREIQDREGEAYLLLNIGLVFVDRPDLGQAREYLTAALSWFQCSDDGRGMGRTLHALGRLELRGGDIDRAVPYLEEAVRRLPVPRLRAPALLDLGTARRRLGQHELAAARLREAEETFLDIGALAGAERARAALAEPDGP